jgi:opacity protein-like surface antigen
MLTTTSNGVDQSATNSGGADFNISRHVFMRAEYRGFVYGSPTYNLTSLDGTDRITHRTEPSIGFGNRF